MKKEACYPNDHPGELEADVVRVDLSVVRHSLEKCMEELRVHLQFDHVHLTSRECTRCCQIEQTILLAREEIFALEERYWLLIWQKNLKKLSDNRSKLANHIEWDHAGNIPTACHRCINGVQKLQFDEEDLDASQLRLEYSQDSSRDDMFRDKSK